MKIRFNPETTTNIPIITMQNTPNTSREMPNSQFDFLRFQVGRIEMRLMQHPIYEGRKLVGYRTGTDSVPTFRLLGYGSTLQKAQIMATLPTPPIPLK